MEQEELKYYLKTLTEEEKDEVILTLASNDNAKDNLRELFLFSEESAKEIVKAYDEYLTKIEEGEIYLSQVDNREYWTSDSIIERNDHLIILNLKNMVNKFKRILDTSQRKAILDLIERLSDLEVELKTYDEYDENYCEIDEGRLIDYLSNFEEDISFSKEFAYFAITIISDDYLNKEINDEIVNFLCAFNGNINDLIEFYPFKKHRYHEAVLKGLKRYFRSKKKDRENSDEQRLIDEVDDIEI